MARKQQVYYQAIGLKDGTILVAFPNPKPRRSRARPRLQIDEEGVYSFMAENDYDSLANWKNVNPFQTTAICLNMKRLVRDRIENRVEALTRQLNGIQDQLRRLEQMLSERQISR